MQPRLDAVEGLHKKIASEVWGCMHHCVQVVQFNRKRLLDAFQVMDLMERRRRRFVDTKKEYLDNTLKPMGDLLTPYSERCKAEIATHLTKTVDDMFRAAEKEAEAKSTKSLDAVLDAANQLLMDLEIVQSDVVGCFPTDVDVLYVFTSTYNAILETEINRLCSHPDVGIAERLQLVQWIEYYNTEILKYKRARASIVLEQTAQMLMSLYLDQIQGQIQMWVTNVWKREEEHVVGLHGELQSTRPNDIINILKSQISIGQEWLTGRLVGRVVNQCLETLMDQLKSRYDTIAARVGEVDIETLCSFINDTDVLQAKCPELVEEISFAARDPDEKEAFDHFMGDGLDTTSTEIVKLAVATCELLVGKIFAEVEHVCMLMA
jgi:exocyst complex component 3